MQLGLVDQQADVIVLVHLTEEIFLLFLSILSPLKFTEDLFLFLDDLLPHNDLRLQDLDLVVDLSPDVLLHISNDLDRVRTLDDQLLVMVVFYKAARV